MIEADEHRLHLENSLAHVDEQIADTALQLQQLGVARSVILQLMNAAPSLQLPEQPSVELVHQSHSLGDS